MGRPRSALSAAAAAFFWFGRTSPTAPPRVPPAVGTVGTLSPPSSPHPTPFGSWCDAVGIQVPHLVLGRAPGDGVPGVLVREDARLRAGECVITVPLEACLAVRGTSSGRGSRSSTGNNVSSEETEGRQEREKREKRELEVPTKIRLACLLLSERRRGTQSYHAGYIDHLPKPYPAEGWERADTLDRWSEEELRLLKSPELVRRTRERVRSDREWFGRLELSKEKKKEEGSSEDEDDIEDEDEEFDYTFEEFVWALGIVRTRAFSGDFARSRSSSSGDTSSRSSGSGSGSGTSEQEQKQEKKVEDYALLPIIDDLNHRESAATAATTARRGHRHRHRHRSSSVIDGMSASSPTAFQYPAVMDVLGRTRTAFCWVAHIAHRPGQEVAHSYLTGSDGLGESFLHEWGFAPGARE